MPQFHTDKRLQEAVRNNWRELRDRGTGNVLASSRKSRAAVSKAYRDCRNAAKR